VKKHAHHLRADPVNPYWAAVQYWFLIALAVLLSAVAVAGGSVLVVRRRDAFRGPRGIYVATLPVVAIFGLSRLVVSQSRRFATVAGKAACGTIGVRRSSTCAVSGPTVAWPHQRADRIPP
jgi:hypothetical protein